MNGDHVTSLEEFDTICMDSVWLAIKTSWKTNDYSRSTVDPSSVGMILRVMSRLITTVRVVLEWMLRLSTTNRVVVMYKLSLIN